MRKLSTAEADARWVKFQALMIFLLVLYFIPQYALVTYWGRAYQAWFHIAVIVLLTLYFSRRGLSGTLEVKVMLLFAVWYMFSRMIGGHIWLDDEYNGIVDCFSYILFLSLCQLLPREGRLKLLDWLGAVIAVFYTLLALICIYAAVFQTVVPNPFEAGTVASLDVDFTNRLYAFDRHPNICGNWFFVAAFLLIYLFFRTKKLPVRVLCALAALVNYAAVALTDSRNCKVAFAVCFGMLCGLLVLRRIAADKKARRALALVLTVLVVFVAAYKGFDAALYCVNRASAASISESSPVGEEGEYNGEIGESTEEPEEAANYSSRTLFNDSSRFFIWKCTFEVLRRNPAILLRGSDPNHLMDPINNYVAELSGWSPGYAHTHTMFLQVLMLAGIPGLLLMLAFVVLVSIRIIRLYFAPSECMAVKVLTLPMTGFLVYNMLDASLFYSFDLRSTLFFVLAGAVTAFSQDIHPLPNTLRRGEQEQAL